MHDLTQYARTLGEQARDASRHLATTTGDARNEWLGRMAELLRTRGDELVSANQHDLELAQDHGLSDASIDRLELNDERISGMASALAEIADLPDPIGEVISSRDRPNGLTVQQVRVPLGVIFFIYESRPNVTVDAAALCVKGGNAVILRGGKEAFHSNQALYRLLVEAALASDLPAHAVQLVETTDRSAVGELLALDEFIDVTIPRGGKSLIERVASQAKMPVIKHFDGVCHVFVDAAADLQMAQKIVVNSKCQRPGVCNAAESLLVHAEIAATFLPAVASELSVQGVILRGCPATCELVETAEVATEEDFRTEYLELILSVRVVADVDAAIEHINSYGSRHTDAIVTADRETARRFTGAVDSSAVMVNASTRFNDGGEFGLGAEIGISTDKFHARGPCGLRELTSYKYVVEGTGQIRQ